MSKKKLNAAYNLPHVSRANLACDILLGRTPTPPTMQIGTICINGHGIGDRGVRYKSNGSCIVCTAQHGYVNKYKPEHLTTKAAALHAYEERQARDLSDPDPLFDED